MIVLLDSGPSFVSQAIKRWPGVKFGQLRTPLTQYARNNLSPLALDNGCFTKFNAASWKKMLSQCLDAVFVTLPDVVGSARRTLELFTIFSPETSRHNRALVLQDGIGDFDIPWNSVQAVFVGGSDEFKISEEAMHACKAAKVLGKWVHVGRVNGAHRMRYWKGIADSIDGSGISRYTGTLDSVCAEITGEAPVLGEELLDLGDDDDFMQPTPKSTIVEIKAL